MASEISHRTTVSCHGSGGIHIRGDITRTAAATWWSCWVGCCQCWRWWQPRSRADRHQCRYGLPCRPAGTKETDAVRRRACCRDGCCAGDVAWVVQAQRCRQTTRSLLTQTHTQIDRNKNIACIRCKNSSSKATRIFGSTRPLHNTEHRREMTWLGFDCHLRLPPSNLLPANVRHLSQLALLSDLKRAPILLDSTGLISTTVK